MIVLKDRPTVFFDVDDTLVMWNFPAEKDKTDIITFTYEGRAERLKIHPEHIEAIKKYKIRGHNVVVWSQGGSDWAKAVIEACGLQEFVDIIVPKPAWFYDDLSGAKVLTDSMRRYIDEEKYLGRK